jgi:hypothetical protein
MLAHTQSQISILVGLDEDSRIADKDAGHVSSGDVPHHQVPDPPNTDVMEEARNLIINDAVFSQS